MGRGGRSGSVGTTTRPAPPVDELAERFTFALDPEPDAVPTPEPPVRRRRPLVADPVWAVSAVVLLTLDAVALVGISRSWWLALMVLIVSVALGSYRHRHTLTLSEGDGRYVILSAATVVPMLALDEPPFHDALFVLAIVAGLLASRTLGFAIVKGIRRRRPQVVFVAGAGHIARELDRVLTEHREYGLRAGAYITDVVVPGTDRDVVPYAEALVAIQEADALGVVCAFGPEQQEELHQLIRECEDDRRRVWVVPRMFDLSPRRDHIWGIAMAVIHRPPSYNPLVRAAKRAIDAVVATVALVLLSPVLGALAIVVRVSSRGPILFRQRRLGRRGREFTMLKFRTMRVSASGDTGWTVPDDPRRTPAGRLLRRTSLDELPQLLNVLRGDMSLVGPRPERRVFAEQFTHAIPTFPERVRVAGGITGLAQVHDLRGDSSIEDRARFDNYYIDQYSLFLDFVIAVKTIGSLFVSKQSY
jgi:exopolysaccharide biosynthesis polyprenyl glycosylphosphotransferase